MSESNHSASSPASTACSRMASAARLCPAPAPAESTRSRVIDLGVYRFLRVSGFPPQLSHDAGEAAAGVVHRDVGEPVVDLPALAALGGGGVPDDARDLHDAELVDDGGRGGAELMRQLDGPESAATEREDDPVGQRVAQDPEDVGMGAGPLFGAHT